MGCNLDPDGHAAMKEIGMPRESLLAQTLVELADSLVDDFDVVELLTLLTDRCVEVLSVAAAGIMLVSAEGELGVMASSNEATRVLELFELQCQEGPCLDCYRTGAPIIAADLTSADGRWPHFAVESLSAGFRSVHALPMRLRGTTIGALNLFRQEAGTLDESDSRAAQAFADVATIAILQNRALLAVQVVNQELQYALQSRVVIEQAKGVLAERAAIDVDKAFTHLRSFARSHNRRLVDVAHDVIDGQLATADVVAPGRQS
jgi:transcriptional regulator with GAF, ATPase, and Fis domain